MSSLALNARQRRGLQRQLRETHDARVYRRTLALLEAGRGTPISRIAQTLGVARQSVHNWIDAYRQNHDPAALADEERSGRPSLWTEKLRARLGRLLERHPSDFGWHAADWNVPLLQEQLGQGPRPSQDTLRRHLHRLGYAWKRGRYVLGPDPERDKKTAAQAPGAAAAVPVASRRPVGPGRDGPAPVPALAGGLGAARRAL